MCYYGNFHIIISFYLKKNWCEVGYMCRWGKLNSQKSLSQVLQALPLLTL